MSKSVSCHDFAHALHVAGSAFQVHHVLGLVDSGGEQGNR